MIIDPTFFQNELFGYVFKKVKDRTVAEDIVHDVFLKVQAKADQIKDNDKVTGWIYQVTRNTIIDHFRFQSRIIHASDLDWEDDKQYLNQCVERCLSENLATLPEKYREALELAEIQGLSQLDLARRLHLSYSGAKSRVQRARQMLKEKMQQVYHVKLDNYGNVIQCENRVPCNCPE
jgi:RNA polymerase sigma-70 factor (ECF subfamily)